ILLVWCVQFFRQGLFLSPPAADLAILDFCQPPRHLGRWHQACSRLLIILQGVWCRWPVIDPTVAASSVRRRRRRDDLGQRPAPGSWLRQFSNAPWSRIRVAREF